MRKHRAIFFRGLLGWIFSRGLDWTAKRVEDELGIPTEVRPWFDSEDIPWAEHTYLIGHSLGARQVVNLTNKRHQFIETAFCLDYVMNWYGQNDLQVNPNVTAFHYRSSDWRTRKLRGANEIYFKDFNHIELDNQKVVQDSIIASIKGSIQRNKGT